MKFRFKKITAFTLSLILLLALGACTAPASSTAPVVDATTAPAAEKTQAASTDTADEPETPSTTDPVDLSIMWWGPDTRHEATVKALDLYTAEVKPNVTFTHEFMAWDGYWSKLVVLAASGGMTDILQMDAQYIDNYISTNQLADISDIEVASVIPDDILENLKVGGKLYGAPVGQNAQGYVYDKTSMEKYGVPLPKEGWTWDEFFAWVEEAGEILPDGVYPTGHSTSWDGYQYYQVAMGGGRVIDGNKLNLNREMWFTYNEKYASWQAKGYIPTPEEAMSFVENDAQQDPMATGKVLMLSKSVGSVSGLVSLMPDSELGVVNSPVGPGGGGWAQATMFWSVGANSTKQEEAKEFITWFLTDLKAGEILMTVRGLPLSNDVYNSIESVLKPADRMGKALYDVTVNNNPTPFYPSSAAFADFVTGTQGFYAATMEQVIFGMITLEDAYDRLVAKGEELGAAQ